MKLPKMKQGNQQQQVVDRFLGLCRLPVVDIRQFAAMQNMSVEGFPTLNPRPKRGVAEITGFASEGMVATDRIWHIFHHLYCNGNKVLDRDGQEIPFDNGPKQMVAMGGQLVVFPDKKVINIADPDRITVTEIEERVAAGDYVLYSPCLLDEISGVEDIQPTRGNTPPENPVAGQYWVDTATHALKQYDGEKEDWVTLPTVYTKITLQHGSGMTFDGFRAFDGVEIADCPQANLNGSAVIMNTGEGIDGDGERNTFIVITGLWETDDVFASAGGGIDPDHSAHGITVERKAPDLDFVVELNNRLWGCNSEKHEIYACALGDPTNWNCFQSTAADSYTATVGTPGDFTGAVAYSGQALFFKDRCIHQVYGTKPANFQITAYDVPGIQEGSHKSACVINEVLYYKATDGVYAYTGGVPTRISEALGTDVYTDAVGGRFKNRYVVAMTDREGRREVLVFDPPTGLWHKEDDAPVTDMVAVGDELYLIADSETEETATRLMSMGGTDHLPGEDRKAFSPENGVVWMVETGDVEAEAVGNLFLSQVRLRMEVEKGSRVRVLVKCDTDREWALLWEGLSGEKRLFTLPVRPRRCMRFRLRLEGIGGCRLYTLQLIREEGSELGVGL